MRWPAAFTLFDAVWPDMSARVARAEALGYPWAAVTTPFAWFEGDRALAHVGVLEHPVRLLGEDRAVAGIHAVCSHPDARGRGLVRRLLEEALAFVDARWDTAKLHTDHPALYAKFGFRVVPTYTWVSDRAGGRGRAVPVDVARVPFAGRAPVSEVLCSRDPGSLPVIDAALARALDRWFFAVPGADWAAAWELRGDTLVVHDVFGPTLPTVEALADAAPPHARVRWSFCPDRFDPAAIPEPVTEGAFQVRGRWPDGAVVGVSPLWEH
ncbi:MAG: GNAT family N-acetyltransferase [Myxococcota bacterium]